MEALIDVLAKLGPHKISVFLKSVCGGWVTSARVRGTRAKFGTGVDRPLCIFGCPQPDSWGHYLKCQPLWEVAAKAYPSFSVYSSTPELLGLKPAREAQIVGTCM
eukprot:8432947-Karenia_brevis.AAC.1